ncbi:uncharacterized protein PGTG_11624 [Puccinia graminis f. sp. tritici CRL 75-36-700-3]|uniref:Uncharacterized protein n=2 Tax=Puccinia graminis f. sp. tritici TaxID=56615 RepID=E3KNJ3_PUCGT|nr:uncharacterized protein PGTG_11624 [Puccinia graminis f. sp. tritici CRL 75-36-700-3]EFP85868.2 hypothetical protein PGTG_11624 [Puccinia graminis f. sp. tritici CRL 75-36-700-3]
MDMNNQMYRPKNYYASSKLSMNDGSSSGSVPPHVSGMLSREQACEALLHPKERLCMGPFSSWDDSGLLGTILTA